MKKAIYFLSSVLGWIIAFGAGIGVACCSKVFAKFEDSDSLKESIRNADEVLDELAKDSLSKETEEATD